MIRGVIGVVKWAYYNAAAIEGYTVTRTKGSASWSLRATVILSDSFKLSQRPLMFEAPHQGGVWRWPIEEFSIVNGTMTARLGRLEGEGSTWNRVLSRGTFAR
jgi:hypothetical protein